MEALLAAYDGQHSSTITAAMVERYLGTIDGRQWPVWQIDQTLDALQRFAQAIGTDWRERVDWQAWRQRCLSPEGSSSEPEGAFPRPVLPEDPTLRTFVERARQRQLSLRTQTTYVEWVRRCQQFHQLADPGALREDHLAPFLSHLAVERQLSVSAQRQALNALVAFFREVHGLTSVAIGSFTFSQRDRGRCRSCSAGPRWPRSWLHPLIPSCFHRQHNLTQG